MPDWIEIGPISGLERQFAHLLGRFGGGDPEAIRLAAALVSRVTGNGDVCLDLAAWAGKPLEGSWGMAACPPLERWLAALSACPAVGRPGERRPLVLDERHRLYLHRYWKFENRLAAGILRRAVSTPETIDRSRLRGALQRCFPEAPLRGPDWQKVAVAVCLFKRFAVISGGPGTGKTTTVAKLLSVYGELQAGRPGRVLLAAPTGKAAARLKEALLHAPAAAGNATAHEVYTVHRLLRPVAGAPRFQYDAEHPLPVDLMIVDEVSMVDLALMAKLVDALPETARLVLIGDRDQLASVEAGSVLGDICGGSAFCGFSPEFAQMIQQVTDQAIAPAAKRQPLQDCIVELQTSHRFDAASRIGALSRAVNRGDALQALEILAGGGDASVAWLGGGPEPSVKSDLRRRIAEGYAGYHPEGSATEVLQALGRFKVLCAHRSGTAGVEAVNRLTEHILLQQGRIGIGPRSGHLWYAGRPVLITQNDYSLGLFNGDIGIALQEVDGESEGLAVFFKDPSGTIRRFMPYRLPPHETVWAMTVHKSQGSEFDEVLLVLPPTDSPVLSRELIYTALTRARRKITVFGTSEVFAAAVKRRIERTSGLRDALWGGATRVAGFSSECLPNPF
jgi:exodeoxyribonuclease V alpha subunit